MILCFLASLSLCRRAASFPFIVVASNTASVCEKRGEPESNRRRSTGRSSVVCVRSRGFILAVEMRGCPFLLLPFLLPLGSQGWLDSADQEMVLTRPTLRSIDSIPLVRRKEGRGGGLEMAFRDRRHPFAIPCLPLVRSPARCLRGSKKREKVPQVPSCIYTFFRNLFLALSIRPWTRGHSAEGVLGPSNRL